MKMEECCLSPKDEGNFVAKANGFARVRRTRANASRGSVGRGRMLREGPLDEGKWLCEGPLDEGECFARVRWTRATSLRGSSTTL